MPRQSKPGPTLDVEPATRTERVARGSRWKRMPAPLARCSGAGRSCHRLRTSQRARYCSVGVATWDRTSSGPAHSEGHGRGRVLRTGEPRGHRARDLGGAAAPWRHESGGLTCPRTSPATKRTASRRASRPFRGSDRNLRSAIGSCSRSINRTSWHARSTGLAPGILSVPRGITGAVRVHVGEPKENEALLRTLREVCA
jgi:hypothetical protein